MKLNFLQDFTALLTMFYQPHVKTPFLLLPHKMRIQLLMITKKQITLTNSLHQWLFWLIRLLNYHRMTTLALFCN